jgi:hypothetical protein
MVWVVAAFLDLDASHTHGMLPFFFCFEWSHRCPADLDKFVGTTHRHSEARGYMSRHGMTHMLATN